MADQAAGPTGVNAIMNGWYSELSDMWPGQAMSLKVEEVLYSGKSDFQDVLVFQSSNYGRVLVLDGAIQVTQRDEFSYQEMMAHLPLCAVSEPAKRVLVVGGGDGGVVREVAKHADVQSVECCDIDKMVPEMSRRFFPEVAVGFEDPRAKLIIGDGLKFVEARPRAMCIRKNATCSAHVPLPLSALSRTRAAAPPPDPPGGPRGDVRRDHRRLLRSHRPGLRPLLQGLLREHAPRAQARRRRVRPGRVGVAPFGPHQGVFVGGSVTYAFCAIPTYPSGQIGFILCTKAGGKTDIKQPARAPPAGLRYYTPEVHKAAFVLPKFAADELKL